MHELGIVQNIVAIVESEAGTNPVLRIRLEIGRLTAVSPEAIRFCFEEIKNGTSLSSASLDIGMIDPRGVCNHCGVENSYGDPPWACSCGSTSIKLVAGMELNIKELEIATCV